MILKMLLLLSYGNMLTILNITYYIIKLDLNVSPVLPKRKMEKVEEKLKMLKKYHI